MRDTVVLIIIGMLAYTIALAGTGDEFIRAAPGGWGFETSKTRARFVPFGGVYFDPAAYTDKPYPRFLMMEKFDEDRTDRHFGQIEKLGANLVRITLSSAVFSPEYGKLDREAFTKLDRMIALARKHNLRVVLDLFVNWEGRSEWLAPGWEQYTDDKSIRGLEFMFSAFAERYRNEPTVFSYLVSDEPKMPWSSEGMRRKWGDWARGKYGSEEKLKKTWPDYPAAGEGWKSISVPPDENKPRSRRLFDYQLFREDIASEFVRRLSEAIRKKDKNHLISMGNLQWSAPMRPDIAAPDLLKPSGYPAFNPAKIGRHLDYLHINCYNWWDSNTACYAQALGRYSYYPGKPVILGEFSFDRKLAEQCRGTFSGFCAWAFYPLPSEPSHNYLMTGDESVTSHGREFQAAAEEIRAGKPALRMPDADLVKIDMMSALTDIPSTAKVYRECIEKCVQGKPVGLRMIPPEGVIIP